VTLTVPRNGLLCAKHQNPNIINVSQIREPYYRQTTKVVKPQWIVDSIRMGKLQPV
jgi:hypothetical protein